MSIKTFPRVTLANLPTPLMEASRLSATLGGPLILIKRDDLSGLAMGGNKARKLEFMMADAQAKGTDVIITTGCSQSNFVLQVAAAARKMGMDAILILRKGRHPEVQGNLLLDKLLNAEVRIMDVALSEIHRIYEAIDDLVNELRKNGRHPYVMYNTDTALGNVGWMNAALEICQQLNRGGITAEYLFVSTGDGGTHCGLALGAKYYRLPFKVIGSSVRCPKEECQRTIAEMADKTAKLLETDISLSPKEIVVYDEYLGEGYGVPTRECIEAIKLVAQTEGIFLDPVYTGKTMSALIDLVHKGRFTSKDTVIFIHTGGTPALFAYDKELMI